MSDLLSVASAAAILGVRPGTVRQRIRSGVMRAHHKPDGHVFLDRAEVERWREIGKLPAGRRSTRARVVTVQQAAELLGLTPEAIYQKIHRDTMVALRDAGGRRLIPNAEIARWQKLRERRRRRMQ